MPQQRLFVSDSFAVLQDAFVTAVQALKTADPLAPLTVLAPSDLLALRLRRAVAWAGSGHVGLYIFTLLDFARETAEGPLSQEGQQPLPPLAAPLIVRKLLSETETSNYFAPLATQPGFPRSFLATIADLKHAGVQPQDLRTFIERAQLRGTYRHKVDSLHVLYDRYARFLTEQQLYDDVDLIKRAAAVLEASPGTTPVFLYGFYEFTPLQRRLVAAALRERDVLVFFPWRADSAYEHATPALSWLTGLGLQYTPLAGTEEKKNDLARLQARLFEGVSLGPVGTSSRPDDSVTLISAPGESREAREIGRTVLQLVRAHGLRFHEIGVLLRDPTMYGPLVAETLTGLGIPCCLSGGLPLIRTQAGQSLHLLCQVLAENYARSRVVEFLGAAAPPFTNLLSELAEYARPARWEAFSIEAGIVRGAGEWRERLSRLEASHRADGGEDADAEDRQVLRACVTFMHEFLTTSESVPRVNTWRGWAEQILRLFRAYVSPTAHTAQVEEELRRLGQLDLLSEQISIGEWCKVVAAALSAATVEAGAFGTDGVFIGDLLNTAGVQFRAVIVPGLVEGGFPRTLRQDPLLLDAERQHLGETLACELPQRGRLSEAERVLFTLTTWSASERLVLTYPRLNQVSGHSQVPSFYLLRVIEALSGQPASFTDLEEWCVRAPLAPLYAGPPSKAMDTLEFHLASVDQALAEGDPAPLGYLPVVAPFFSCALHAAHQRWDTPRLTAFDGMIEDESVRAVLHRHLFPAAMVLSTSALETYARCPFRYFLSAVLGLTPQEDPERVLTLQPRDRGALLHDILYDFFTRLRAAGRLPLATQDQTELARLLAQVAEEHFQAFARTKATGFPLLWEVEQERMQERLGMLLKREGEAGSDFFPAAFEARFGAAGAGEGAAFFPTAPVRFTLDDGEESELRGRIDRIDLSSDQRRARILDYKSGKPVHGRFAGGTALQLPLYLFAARALRPDLTWVSAEYAYVAYLSRGGAPRFTADTWPESLATLRQVVTILVQGIRSGCFFPTPDTCRPCAFPLLCGAQVEARVAAKQSDPRLDLWRQMRAIE